MAVALHFSWIKLSVMTNHWGYFYSHTLIIQLSFSTFTILNNKQDNGEIYELFEYKLMLYFGHQTILFLTTLNMSVSFVATTLGNIISSMVINQFFEENYGVNS
jgi:hypothetical protein